MEGLKMENELFEQKLQEFRIWALTEGRYSESTVERSVRRIKELSKKINVLNPSQKEILNFYAKLKERGIKPHTMNNMRKDLMAWFRFLGIKIEIPKFKEPPIPEPWIPTDQEVLNILKASEWGDKGIAMRNKLITELLFFGGIRIGELIKINLDDLRENGIKIRSEKGEAERFIGLPEEMMKDIKTYIEYYRNPSDPTALFTTKKGRISYQYVRNLLKRIGQRAGVPRFHAHSARHWCATALLKGFFGSPLDIRLVQIHLGHKSLRTTERYTHITQEEVAEEVRKRINQFFHKTKAGPKIANPHMHQVGLPEFKSLVANLFGEVNV
jgi:integrase